MNYELGLANLKQRLPKEALVEYRTLEARLRSNLKEVRDYGNTEIMRADRARVVEELNRLAMQHVGQSFNDLCREPAPASGPIRDRRALLVIPVVLGLIVTLAWLADRPMFGSSASATSAPTRAVVAATGPAGPTPVASPTAIAERAGPVVQRAAPKTQPDLPTVAPTPAVISAPTAAPLVQPAQAATELPAMQPTPTAGAAQAIRPLISGVAPSMTAPISQAAATPSARANLDALLGENNWFCFPHRQDELGIKRFGDPFTVRSPLKYIDTPYNKRLNRTEVYTGTSGATAAPESPLPLDQCPPWQKSALEDWQSAQASHGTDWPNTRLDSLFGEGKWHCTGKFDFAVTVEALPQSLAVQYPLTAVDVQDGTRYGVGEKLQGGGKSTVWLAEPITECP